MAKRDFFVMLPELIKFNNGEFQITRPNLLQFCKDQNVSIPALIKNHRTGRGTFDLEPLLKAGDQLYQQGTLEPEEPEPEKTDDEILSDINSRFASLDLMTYGVVNGDFRSLIVSGNPGIGKTYTLEYILESARDSSKIMFNAIRGYVRPTGLYKLLWEHREKNQVLMFDDADSVFADEIGLNLLKGALDTTKRRTIGWRSEKTLESEAGEQIPLSFDFNGSVIFVSNINFQRAVQTNNKLAPHLEALMSRSYYLDLNMTNARELMVRIKSVVQNSDILSALGSGIKKKDQKVIVDYIESNIGKLRELSLRTVIKLGTIWVAAGDSYENFKKMADATTLKRG